MASLHDLAMNNPSLAGRAKLLEILDNEDKFQNLRDYLVPEDGVNPNEHASELHKQSPTLRALYEDGSDVKGETTVIRTGEERVAENKVKISDLSYTLQQIPDREQARRFYEAANTITGAQPSSESKLATFKHFYGQINKNEYGETRSPEDRTAAIEQTLSQMEELANEIRPIDEAYLKGDPVVAERMETEREATLAEAYREIEGEPVEPVEIDEITSNLDEYATLGADGSGVITVKEGGLTLPSEATAEARERYITTVLPRIDQQLESGVNPEDIKATIYQRANELHTQKLAEKIESMADKKFTSPEEIAAKYAAMREGRVLAESPASRIYASMDEGKTRVPIHSSHEFFQLSRMARNEGNAYREMTPEQKKEMGGSPGAIRLYTEKGTEIPQRNAGIEQATGFLTAYTAERMKDPTTRLLNSSPTFREAYNQLNGAKTPAELNEIASGIAKANQAAYNQTKAHLADPSIPKPQPALSYQERDLLFRGAMPDHYTPQMREVRIAWGALPKERAEMKAGLADGSMEKSKSLQLLETELSKRTSVKAVNHLWAAIKGGNENAKQFQEAYSSLGPHERDYFYEAKQSRIAGFLTPPEKSLPAPDPTKSTSYREYVRAVAAEVGDVKGLPPAEAKAVRENAQFKAWWDTLGEGVGERNSAPSPAERKLADIITNAQERLQVEARAARDMKDGFINTKLAEYDGQMRLERNSQTYEAAFRREIAKDPEVAKRYDRVAGELLTRGVGEEFNWEKVQMAAMNGNTPEAQKAAIQQAEKEGMTKPERVTDAADLKTELPAIEALNERTRMVGEGAHEIAYKEMVEAQARPLYTNEVEKAAVVAQMTEKLSPTDTKMLASLDAYAEHTKTQFLQAFPAIDEQRELVRAERGREPALIDNGAKAATMNDSRWWQQSQEPSAVPVTNIPSPFER